jgi:ligand-binding sensor domain-containing protein
MWTVYTPNNSALPVNSIHGIAIDQSDNVWLALGDYVTQSYLVKISNDKWNVYDEKDFGFTPYYFGGIQCDSKNRLWVNINYSLSSTIDPSRPTLFIFDGKTATILSSCTVISLIDHSDNAWGYGWCDGWAGVGVWIGKQWTQFDSSEFGGSGSSGRLPLIKEDPYHKMWFGTENGIYIAYPSK